MIPISINKDVFGASYNDLKFTVRDCNYFFINLVNFFKDGFRVRTQGWYMQKRILSGSGGISLHLFITSAPVLPTPTLPCVWLQPVLYFSYQPPITSVDLMPNVQTPRRGSL